jgi:hypothetical protein
MIPDLLQERFELPHPIAQTASERATKFRKFQRHAAGSLPPGERLSDPPNE